MKDHTGFRVLNGNILKLIALAAMTVDHVGLIIYPQVVILRIIGRLAFPVFAFMISEGAYYTRNRKKYFLLILAAGVFCQVVMYIAAGSLYQCILITFAFSVLIIFSIQKIQAGFRANRKLPFIWCLASMLIILALAFISFGLPKVLSDTDFALDYGFWGVMLPVFVYLPNLFLKPGSFKSHLVKLPVFAAGLCLIAISIPLSGIQWWSILAVILMALYNGKRGRINLKYLFYIYYPVHLGIIYFICDIVK